MRKLSCCITALAMMAVITIAMAQETQTETSGQLAWFDLENCEVCKHIADDWNMMKHVKWETHLIDNGALSVSVVPEEFASKVKSAKQQMKAAIAKVAGGEKVKCCGYCQSMGSLVSEGAKVREIASVGGDISMVTSDDPAVVAKIHEHAKRTISEHKKMLKEMEHTHAADGETIPATRDR